jgi:tRNA 2-thiouridine synthesizing protein A
MEDIKFDKVLDCVGLYCPVPIIKTKAKIETMQAGEVLEVSADDPGILNDMPAWAKTTGNEYLGSKEDEGIYKVYVRKKGK